MGLTRQLKRKFARDNRKREMKDLYAHVDRVTAEHQRQLRKEYEEARIDEDTKNMVYAMYYLMGIGLHEQFGFGGQRCLRLFNWVDRELGTWQAGEINTAGLRKKLYDAIGIDVVLDGRKHDE